MRTGNSPPTGAAATARLVSSDGLGLGLGRHVVRFGASSQWAHIGQGVKLRGGATYLYTAWIWNQGMEGGSNINQTLKDGRSRALTTTR